jgi:hypothetical protein
VRDHQELASPDDDDSVNYREYNPNGVYRVNCMWMLLAAGRVQHDHGEFDEREYRG